MGVLRFFYSSACVRDLNKSALALLREKTGYTFANCRKALQLHDNDPAKAEQWLREQAKQLGWNAALKVQNRKTSQGLIGIAINNKKLAMVEMNCETDFVSRNDKFRSMVGLVAETCLQHPVLASGVDTNQVSLRGEEIGKLKADGHTLADQVALLIGSMGENMLLRRAFCFETTREDVNIAVAVHPSSDNSKVLLGKYGSFVSFQRNPESSLINKKTTEELGQDLCKHIIGMNPLKIGEIGKDEPSKNADDETALIHQEFLLDQSLTVGQLLQDSGATILDFKRFECGEPANEEPSSVEENETESLIRAKA